MTDFTPDYTALYRWEWFRRARWQGTFRERKRHSAGGFAELVRERGLVEEPVLDCSCGLGLKTIVLCEAGLHVEGSDKCALAVELARRLAAEEGHGDIGLFETTWADLPRATPTRYAAVFNDALSWVYSDEEMAASLRGIHDVLRPGGLLAYMGALPGSSEDREALLEDEWQRLLADVGGRWGLGSRHAEGGITVTELLVHERGPDFIDRHRLFLIDDAGREPRLETMTERHSLKWGWATIEPFLRRAGFREFTTKAFTAASDRHYELVVAIRD